MAIINFNDIVNYEQGVSDMEQRLTAMLTSLKNTAESTKAEISKTAPSDTAALSKYEKRLISLEKHNKKLTDQLTKLKEARKKVKKVLTETEKAQSRLTKAQKDENVEIQKLNAKTREANRLAKARAAVVSSQVGSVEELRAKLTLARIEFDKLSASERNNSKVGGRLLKNIKQLNNELTKVEESSGRFQRNVGNYPKAFQGAQKSIGKFRNLLGGLGLAYGGAAIVKDVFSTITGFEDSIANLSAITGASGEDLDFFKKKAIELGSSTTLSAGEVADAFRLIGSAKPELLGNQEALAGVTEQTIILAEAAKIDLTDAAGALTNTLNQFGAGADQAGKFVDVLAAGSKAGAGDINFLNEAFDKAGTVASSAGLTFVESASALEVLAQSGADASTSGTNFRNILVNLQKEGIGFVDGQFDLRAALEQVNGQLNSIEDPAERAAKSVELFGKQGLAAGTFLRENIGLYDQLNEQLDVNGVAMEQQRKNNDTVIGSLKGLQSAWEGYILGTGEAGGVSDKLKSIIQFLTRNLETILNTIISVAKAFVLYKGTVIASKVAMKAWSVAGKVMAVTTNLLKGNFKGLGTGIKGAIKNFKGLGTGIKGAIKNFKALNATMKANIFGAIVAGISLVVDAFSAWGDEAEKTAEKVDFAAEASRMASEEIGRETAQVTRLTDVLKDENATRDEKNEAIKELNEKYPEFLGNLDAEKINTEELNVAMEKQIKLISLRSQIKALESLQEKEYAKIAQLRLKQEKDTRSEVEKSAALLRASVQDTDNSLNRFDTSIIQDKLLSSLEETKKGAKNDVDTISNLIRDLQGEIDALLGKPINVSSTNTNDDESGKKAAKAARRTQIDLSKELLQIQLDYIKDAEVLEKTKTRIAFTEQRKRFENELKNEKDPKRREQLNEILIGLDRRYQQEITDITLKFSNKRIAMAEKEAEELQKILGKGVELDQQANLLRFDINRDELDRQIQALQGQSDQKSLLKLQELNRQKTDLEKARIDVETSYKLEKIREVAATELETLEEQISDIDQQLGKAGELREQGLLSAEEYKQRATELANIREELGQQMLAITENQNKEENLIYEKGNEKKKKLDNDLLKKKEEFAEKSKEIEKKNFQEIVKKTEEIANYVFDFFSQLNQKLIEVLESQVEQQNNAVTEQAARAANGLENTLAFERDQLAKRQGQLEEAQKKAERLEKIKALFASMANYAQQGDPAPFAKAAIDIALAEGLAASFGDGGIVGIDGYNNKGITTGESHSAPSGGVLARFEGGEGFLSRKEMKVLGKENFYRMKDDLKSGVLSSNFLGGHNQQFQSVAPILFDNSAIVSELKDVKKAIKSQPKENVRWAELANGLQGFLVEKSEAGTVKKVIYPVSGRKVIS